MMKPEGLSQNKILSEKQTKKSAKIQALYRFHKQQILRTKIPLSLSLSLSTKIPVIHKKSGFSGNRGKKRVKRREHIDY